MDPRGEERAALPRVGSYWGNKRARLGVCPKAAAWHALTKLRIQVQCLIMRRYEARWKPFERRHGVNDPRNNAPLGSGPGSGGPGNRPSRPQFSGRAWLIMLVV